MICDSNDAKIFLQIVYLRILLKCAKEESEREFYCEQILKLEKILGDK